MLVKGTRSKRPLIQMVRLGAPGARCRTAPLKNHVLNYTATDKQR